MRKIKLYNWDIEIIEDSIEKINKVMGKDKKDRINYIGAYDYVSSKVYVYKKLECQIKKKTLIHELSHAIIALFGYKINFNEENICDFMGAHLDVIHNIVEEYFNENNQQQ